MCCNHSTLKTIIMYLNYLYLYSNSSSLVTMNNNGLRVKISILPPHHTHLALIKEKVSFTSQYLVNGYRLNVCITYVNPFITVQTSENCIMPRPLKGTRIRIITCKNMGKEKAVRIIRESTHRHTHTHLDVPWCTTTDRRVYVADSLFRWPNRQNSLTSSSI